MSTINLSDLDKKMEQVQSGRKNISAKKGLNNFFTPQIETQYHQVENTARPIDSNAVSQLSHPKSPAEKISVEKHKHLELNEIEKLKQELEEERKKFESEKRLLLKKNDPLKIQEREKVKEREIERNRERNKDRDKERENDFEQIILPKQTQTENPEINGQKIDFQSLFLATTLFREFTTPEVKFLRCILSLTRFGQLKDVHIGYDEVKDYGIQSGQLKPLRDRFLALGIISCRTGKKSQRARSVEFYTLNSFKFNS